MLEQILKALQNYSKETIIAALVFVTFIWLYKEIRNSFIDSEKAAADRIHKAIELYAELDIELNNYFHSRINDTDMDSKLSKVYPYLPKNILEKFMEWNKEREKEAVPKLSKYLHDEIIRLKYSQKDVVASTIGDTTIGSIELFFHNSRLKTFLQPIKLLVFLVILIIYIIVVYIFFRTTDISGKIYIIIASFNLIFYFMMFMVLSDVLIAKRFVNKCYNWSMIIFLIIVPIIFQTFLYKWYIAVVGFVLFWIYVYKFMPVSIKKLDD